MPDVAELFGKAGGRVMRLSPADTDALIRGVVLRRTGSAGVADACGRSKWAATGNAAVDGGRLLG